MMCHYTGWAKILGHWLLLLVLVPYISQGSVAAHLSCGGIFIDLLLSLIVKKKFF